jgi:preprotein translocase subunit SecD
MAGESAAHEAPQTDSGVSEYSFAVRRPAGVPRASLAFHSVLAKPGTGGLQFVDQSGCAVTLANTPFITNDDVIGVNVSIQSDFEHYVVTLHFSDGASARLKAATAMDHPSRRFGVLIDGELFIVGRAVVPLDRSVQLANQFTKAEATDLAQRLAP